MLLSARAMPKRDAAASGCIIEARRERRRFATSPLPSGRASQRSPRRNVLRGQGQPTETAAIMFELSESRQHLLGTKRYVVSTRLTHRPTNRISLPGTCISDKSFHRWNQANALALRNLEGKGVAAFPTGILGLSGNSRQCWESGSEYGFR